MSHYCCLQGQLCGLCLWFWQKRKMRVILRIKMTLQKWRCKNDIAISHGDSCCTNYLIEIERYYSVQPLPKSLVKTGHGIHHTILFKAAIISFNNSTGYDIRAMLVLKKKTKKQKKNTHTHTYTHEKQVTQSFHSYCS